jgi:hypothetical protein
MLMHTPCVLAFDDFRVARVRSLSQIWGDGRIVSNRLFFLYDGEGELAAIVVSISKTLDERAKDAEVSRSGTYTTSRVLELMPKEFQMQHIQLVHTPDVADDTRAATRPRNHCWVDAPRALDVRSSSAVADERLRIIEAARRL